jgi:hypothetical protein
MTRKPGDAQRAALEWSHPDSRSVVDVPGTRRIRDGIRPAVEIIGSMPTTPQRHPTRDQSETVKKFGLAILITIGFAGAVGIAATGFFSAAGVILRCVVAPRR